MSLQKSDFRKEDQSDWAAVLFYWSSLTIIPTPQSAASDFLHCLDDNVLRQATKVMTISQRGTAQGCCALRSNILALHSAAFNTDTSDEIDTKICHELNKTDVLYARSDKCDFNCFTIAQQSMGHDNEKQKSVHSPPPPPRRLEFAGKREKKMT